MSIAPSFADVQHKAKIECAQFQMFRASCKKKEQLKQKQMNMRNIFHMILLITNKITTEIIITIVTVITNMILIIVTTITMMMFQPGILNHIQSISIIII